MRRILWLMAAILLLVQPAPAIDCSLMGIDGLKVAVSIQVTDRSSYGDSALYASLMKNQLSQNEVYVIPDNEPLWGYPFDKYTNGAVLRFIVHILEHTYKETGMATGDVTFSCHLELVDDVLPNRLDTSLSQARLIAIDAVIWQRRSLHFEPERRSVKSTIKETLSEGITQLVAELREANSANRYRELEEHWRVLDSLLEDYQEAKKTKH